MTKLSVDAMHLTRAGLGVARLRMRKPFESGVGPARLASLRQSPRGMILQSATEEELDALRPKGRFAADNCASPTSHTYCHP